MKNQLLLTDVSAGAADKATLIAQACCGLNADSDHWRTAARQKLRSLFPPDRYFVHIGGCHIAVHERKLCPETGKAYLVEDTAYGPLIARVIETPVDPRSRSRKYELSRGGIPVETAAANTIASWALVPAGFWGGQWS